MNKACANKLIGLLIIMAVFLLGCEKENPIAEPNEEFDELINKEIVKIENENSIAAKIGTDVLWVEEKMKKSELCERPDAIIALDLNINIEYKDNTTATLRLLNPDEGACSLRYDEISYCFENDEIAQWLLQISNNTLPESTEAIDKVEETAQIDGFTQLTNMKIVKVTIYLPTGEVKTETDIEWLEDELALCSQCDYPDEDDKRDLPIEIFYDDDTFSELVIYNIGEGYFEIRYNDNRYCFRSEAIAQWILDIQDSFTPAGDGE